MNILDLRVSWRSALRLRRPSFGPNDFEQTETIFIGLNVSTLSINLIAVGRCGGGVRASQTMPSGEK